MGDVRSAAPLEAVAYFSMEIALEPSMPTYGGGLGVLAGDSLRAAADLGAPMIGVSLLYRKGYFRQHLDVHGNQSEAHYAWSPGDFLEPVRGVSATVTIEGRPVKIAAWRYSIQGVRGQTVPVYFLDTAVPENDPTDQTLTDHLYGGDARYRLSQEAVLGIGGVQILRALGYTSVHTFHMNEGHSALLALALVEEQTRDRGVRGPSQRDIDAVRRRCVFTTHTPVPAGHDEFPPQLVRQVLGDERADSLTRMECCNGALNMTRLALFFSRYINGVSVTHTHTARGMYPNHTVNAITNGVHVGTWTSRPFSRLFDRHIPDWRQDNRYLRHVITVPLGEIQAAHAQAKSDLLAEIGRRTGVMLDSTRMTIGFARRATPYKRADMLFSDIERLQRITQTAGPLQIIYGGKAHPRDEGGKQLIRNVFNAAASLGDAIRVVYLEEYDMSVAKLLCPGVDLWLNTPQKQHEASGTSGMKAALNGVPSLSVLDGWWVEGHFENVTGWAVGNGVEHPETQSDEAASLYDKLEHVILPMFYIRPQTYAEVMRSAIAVNGSFFTAQRMVSQYVENAYGRRILSEATPLHD